MSEVVGLQWVDGAIALITMEDRATKNRFSARLLDGLERALLQAEADPGTRVVVVTGYENYFCCGGTKEELLLLASGQARFTDFSFYDRLLRCEFPVVAAMQGHAIGGGFVFGMHADMMVLAQESIYSANFMEYGITPGVGATWALPARLGTVLGWEMLFTGRNYFGGELRARGAPVQVTSRGNVVALSLSMARDLAVKPALALRELKRCFHESIHAEYRQAIQRELGMHAKIFSQPEAVARIQKLYVE